MAWTISKASGSATGSPANPLAQLDRSRSPTSKKLLKLSWPHLPLEIQIVDTPESPETTVNAGFTVGRQQIDRTLVIAYTIFAGEKGMQFITLFLIVIAIILFGIMGTLEGRELAALLGGLSGYILGRTSTASVQAEEKSLQAQRAQAAGDKNV